MLMLVQITVARIQVSSPFFYGVDSVLRPYRKRVVGRRRHCQSRKRKKEDRGHDAPAADGKLHDVDARGHLVREWAEFGVCK